MAISLLFRNRGTFVRLRCVSPAIKAALMLLSLNMLCISEVSAREWLIEPSISTSAQYNDNPRLSENAQTEISKVTLSPTVKLGYHTPRIEFVSSMRLHSSKYNKQIFDSNDWYGDALLRKKSELSHVELAVDYAYDSTQVSEIEDTGLVQDNKRRSRFGIHPAWQYQVDFKNRLNINYSFDDVSYNEGQASGLFDYNNQLLSTRLLHQLRIKTFVGLMVYASRFNSSGRGSEFTDIGFQGSYKYSLTETMELELAGGVRQTDLEVALSSLDTSNKVEGSDAGGVYSASLVRRWQRTRIEASLQRSIEPSGSGYVVLRNQAVLRLKQQLTEKWTALFSLKRAENNALIDEIKGVDRNYISFDSRLSWRWDRNITLSGLYRYQQQKYDTRANTAQGNSIEARLNYRWVR
ncbi:hypothetical protein MNBD_GAMMA16-2085 [hydrothermal vent metagenome]|uniref:Capsular polysaccharide synthesis enzyme CpsB n=1 Tax=hydrothermal vent metagenome TaxID=652676 RepID=A0A3B1A051_9ZZZZ